MTYLDDVNYIRQEGYAIVVVCLSVSNFVQKLPDLHEIFREGWQLANEQTTKFWWRSRRRIRRIRRALAEACTVPVLLVSKVMNANENAAQPNLSVIFSASSNKAVHMHYSLL